MIAELGLRGRFFCLFFIARISIQQVRSLRHFSR
ncbi:Uncharacterised protein [Vibrio cholerae]|nr:Uncharacterised protein [Vibrio cholerae]